MNQEESGLFVQLLSAPQWWYDAQPYCKKQSLYNTEPGWGEKI